MLCKKRDQNQYELFELVYPKEMAILRRPVNLARSWGFFLDIPKNKNLHHKSSSEKYQWILLLSHWGYFEIFEIASTAQK